MISILIGWFPFAGQLGKITYLENNPLTVVVGAGLLLSGLLIMYLSGKELGGSLSHWSVPVKKSQGGKGLVSTGVYRWVRHPMYLGLLGVMTGLGIATNSSPRLLLSAALFGVLQLKATHEETKLQEEYPEYKDYKTRVHGKIIPFSFL